MPNITVTASEEGYRAARVWAAQNDTSISAIVRFCIEHLPAATMRQPEESEKVPLTIAPPQRLPENAGV